MRKAFSLLPGEFHGAGQATLHGIAESDMTVQLTFTFFFILNKRNIDILCFKKHSSLCNIISILFSLYSLSHEALNMKI